MRISELIAKLMELARDNGDVEVLVEQVDDSGCAGVTEVKMDTGTVLLRVI
jgi:hypothetical protein